MNKKQIIIIVVTALIIILGFLFLTRNKNSSKLKNFSETEIKWIQTLSKQDQDYFLNNKNLYPLIKQKSFQASKFSKYLSL